jgi:hypothetical protein
MIASFYFPDNGIFRDARKEKSRQSLDCLLGGYLTRL